MTTATFKLSPVDFELWRTVLWCSTDSVGQPLDREHTIYDVDQKDVERLNADFYQFKDRADNVLIKNGRGDACLDDLWPTKVEHLFVLIRDGHGVSFTDDWIPGSRTHSIALELDRIARQYPGICATADDDGRSVYCYWS